MVNRDGVEIQDRDGAGLLWSDRHAKGDGPGTPTPGPTVSQVRPMGRSDDKII
jgi:hypothetical protein